MTAALPFLVLALTAASAGFSVKSQLDAAKKQKRARRRQLTAQREAERIKQVRANVASRKERREQLREARIRKAQILSSSTLAGAGEGTTTTIGAIGSIGTKLGRGIGELQEARGFGEALSLQAGIVADEQENIVRAGSKNQINQAISGAVTSTVSSASSIFARGGGSTSLFGGNTFQGNSLFGNN
jgi:sRNA-binding protein